MKKIISFLLILCMCFAFTATVFAADNEDIVYTNYNNVYGWYYTVNGKVQPDFSGVKSNSNGWWRVYNGKVDFSANGIYHNDYGWWKTTNGKVTFNETGVFHNENGWWRVVNSKVDFGANGIYHNDYGWWKTTNGKVTFDETGIFHNENGWWRVVNSKVDFGANGIYQNPYGWWKTTNGRVTFNETGVFQGADGWYRVENSKVNFNANGVYENANGWWKVTNGKVDFDFTGIGENSNGMWYIENGKVNFKYSGVYYSGYEIGDKVYYINNGKVDFVTVIRSLPEPEPEPEPIQYDYEIYLLNIEQELWTNTFNNSALLYIKTDNPDPSTIAIDGVSNGTIYNDKEQLITDTYDRFGIAASEVVNIPNYRGTYDSRFTGGWECVRVDGGYFLETETGTLESKDWIIKLYEKTATTWTYTGASINITVHGAEETSAKLDSYAREIAEQYFGEACTFSWEALHNLCADMRAQANYPHVLRYGNYLYSTYLGIGTPWGPNHVMDSAVSPGLLGRILSNCDGVTYINAAANDWYSNNYHAYLKIDFEGVTQIATFCPSATSYDDTSLPKIDLSQY